MLQIQVGPEKVITVPLAVEAQGAEAIEAYVAAAKTDPATLEGLPFASRSARDAARKGGLSAHAFRVPKGTLITIEDVRKMLPPAEPASPEEPPPAAEGQEA